MHTHLARRIATVGAIAAAAFVSTGIQPVHAVAPLAFGPRVALPQADGGTEPRAAVTPDGHHFVVSNSAGTMTVYESDDGLTNWHKTSATPVGQMNPTIDVDIIATSTGRLVVSELDFGGVNFRTSYSDDQGATWTASTGILPFSGTGAVDQDRQWLAAGPNNRVYLLFHNLASGTITHNMFVITSTDNGATFGFPIPITNPATSSPSTPGSQAWQDLQCADSGGPSDLFVNPRDGRVYAVWGTRSAQTPLPVGAGGGCTASVTGNQEVNVVAATRVWVATAPASGTTDATQWTNSLAVDDNPTGQIVGMQLAPGAIDSADNVYILYPESVRQYPDYSGAAIKYVHASQTGIVANPYGLTQTGTNPWSTSTTVAAPNRAITAGQPGDAGHLLPHIAAAGPGQLDMAYFTGDTVAGKGPSWYITAAQTLNALDAHPAIQALRVSDVPTYTNQTASQMMGACTPSGIVNGVACGRSTDVWGVAIDNNGNFLITWPGVKPNSGTFVTTQIAGLTANVAETPWAALLLLPGAAIATIVATRRRSPRQAPG
ncbi:MAG: exo-alpha-sialidase [Candidatus Dormibacteraeota bacterium]|uniref:Exo-alpha-sialidase n=1 Tax=Candidatus Amunia macphersoniae TaxID=3127014 RepID=A0A934KIG1_9BACT|nr:exo-alpha-sialidase [Candidatus Dormibacteraeota bacterium]